MKRTLFFLKAAIFLSLFHPSLSPAQETDRYADDFVTWVRTLGSDEFGGRQPMTIYEEKTINYLADEFRKLGLEGAFDGDYFQKVKEITTHARPENGFIRVRTDGGRFDMKYPDDCMVWTSRAVEKVELHKVGYVFCGFGIDATEYGWNDFEGTDVRGKIVIMMVNDPGFYDNSLFRGRNMTYYGRWCYKFEQALRMGAAGCLVVHNTEAAGYGWHVIVNGHTESNLDSYNEETNNSDALALQGWITEDACRGLLRKSGLDPEKVFSDARKPGFRAIPLKATGDICLNVSYETGETCNVCAVLPGTDLKDECVVFSAHWDHFGTGKPDSDGDSIYNGAADNGSGLAAILMIAKKLGEVPRPRRSMVFLCTTSEESGMWGSLYYCQHPAFPMEKTLACINFDCVAPSPLTWDFVILGGGQSNLDNHIFAAAAAQGRHVVFDNDNSDGWFFRSDHINFVRRGVPAVVIMEGRELVCPQNPNKYPRASWYHKTNDEYRDDWDITGALANINLMYSAGLSVANMGL